MLGSAKSIASGLRPPPKADVEALDKQLLTGEVEVNATLLTRDQLIEWAAKLKAGAARVKTLRILCVPKGSTWSQYYFSHMQDRRADVQHIFSSREHRHGVQTASANLQHHLVRIGFYKAICEVLRVGQCTELVIGLRFSESGCHMLSRALATNRTVKRLSFAGSLMGDERFMWLKPGLIANNVLEELDLTACGLTDFAAMSMAAVLKAHADRRMGLVFDEQLRCYPDPSLPPHAAHAAFHSRLRAIGRDVDERCGGLLHLELAENKLTDKAARSLRSALSYDRRLIFLSMRANRLTADAESEFIALMKEHQALLRVDLRQNTAAPEMGILKLKRRVVPRVFSSVLGFQPNPRAPLPASPALTHTSMPLWALQEELPNSLGPTPMAATPRHPSLAFPADTPARLSTISWGDAHLLTRGSPRTTLAALAAATAAAAGGRRSPQRRRRAASAGANAHRSPSPSLTHSQSPAPSAQSGPGAFYYYEGQGRMSTGQLLIHGSSRMGRMRRVSLSAPTSPIKAGDAAVYHHGVAMEGASDMAGWGGAGLVRSMSGGFSAGEPSFYPGGGSLAASLQGLRPRTAPAMQTVPEEERSFQAGGGGVGGEDSARASYCGGAGAGQVWVNSLGVMGTPGRPGGGAVGAGGGQQGGGEDGEEEGQEDGGGGRVRGKLSRFPTFSVGLAGRGEGGDAQRPGDDGRGAQGGAGTFGEGASGSMDGTSGQHHDLFWAGAQGSAPGVDPQQGGAMGFATAGFGEATFGVGAPQTGSVPLPGFAYPPQGRVSEVQAEAAAAAGQVPGPVAVDGDAADWWVDTGRGGVLAAPLVSRVGRAVDAAAAAIAAAAGATGTEPGVRQQPGAWEHAAVAAVRAAAATAAAAAVAVAAEAGTGAQLPGPTVWETQGQAAWAVGAQGARARGLDLPSSGGGHGSSVGGASGRVQAAAASGGGGGSGGGAGGWNSGGGVGAVPFQGKGQDAGVVLRGASAANTIPADWQQHQQQEHQPVNSAQQLPSTPGVATLQQWLLYQQQARTAQPLALQHQLPVSYPGQYLEQQALGQPPAQQFQQYHHMPPLPRQQLQRQGQVLGGLLGHGQGWLLAGGAAVGVDAMSDAARQAAFLSMLQQQQEQQALGLQVPDDHLAPFGPIGLPMHQYPVPYDSVGPVAAGGPQLWMEGHNTGTHPGRSRARAGKRASRSRSRGRRTRSALSPPRSQPRGSPHRSGSRATGRTRSPGGRQVRQGAAASSTPGRKSPAKTRTKGKRKLKTKRSKAHAEHAALGRLDPTDPRYAALQQQLQRYSLPADPTAASSPVALAVLQQTLIHMASEVERLEAEAAAERRAQEEAVWAAEEAARARERAEAEARARAEAEARLAAERAAKAAKARAEAAKKERLRRELAALADVRPYGGAALPGGVNVNTIVQQLDKWCGLKDDAVLLPPARMK